MQQSLIHPMDGDVVAERAQAFIQDLAARHEPGVGGRAISGPTAGPGKTVRRMQPASPPTPPAFGPEAGPAPVGAPASPEEPWAAQAAAETPRSHPEIPDRDYTATRELIHTACGRRVLREYVDGYHRYQLWEPIVAGASYGTTRRDREGATWGLARTRRPARPLTDFGELVDHELEQARRVVTVLRATVDELGLRDAHSRPGGIGECIYVSRGDVILMTDPAAAAARARSQRGAQ